MPFKKNGKLPQASHGPSTSKQSKPSNWKASALDGSGVVLRVIKEAATLAPGTHLKEAVGVALAILDTYQAVIANQVDFKILIDDASSLIVAIWNSYTSANDPESWLSPEKSSILVDLVETLNSIKDDLDLERNKGAFKSTVASKADVGKIIQYRHRINTAMQKFELQSSITIHQALEQVIAKLDAMFDQLKERNIEELNRIAEEYASRSQTAFMNMVQKVVQNAMATELESIERERRRLAEEKSAARKADIIRMRAEKARRELLKEAQTSHTSFESVETSPSNLYPASPASTFFSQGPVGIYNSDFYDQASPFIMQRTSPGSSSNGAAPIGIMNSRFRDLTTPIITQGGDGDVRVSRSRKDGSFTILHDAPESESPID
ncbi:hypothetical protein B0H34DRAFT_738837 [Crassisporium funariophilum]|nr:hypothetical protein B0H34DRAFT_738837 [Crassisporium funariophilum]